MAEDTPGATTTAASTVRRLGIDEARKILYDLVEAAAAGQPALIGRGTKCAVLSPLSHLDSTWQAQLSALPAMTVTTARKKLGDLLAAAASGTPQLLLHRRTPAAALLPQAPTTHPTTATPTDIPTDATTTAARRLTALDDALDEVLTPGASPTYSQAASFGLHALDHTLGGLRPGTLTLIAAAPGAGGSLLAAAAARHTALTRQLPVLYAASGLTRADIAARIIAAETPVDYRRLRTGTLAPAEEQAAAETRARLAGAPLHMDDGTGLTAEVIAQTAPDITGLALVVVDRLQHIHDPAVPLSGPALPAAARILSHLARTRNIPVLAAFDTDLPEMVNALDPDVTLTLVRTGQHTHIDVAERDFGPQTTTQLRAELPYARFTDPTDSAPAPGSVQATPTSPGSHQLPPPAREAATIQNTTPSGTISVPEQPHAMPAAAPARQQRRLSSAKTTLSTFVADRVASALEAHDGDADAALKALAGDGGSAIPDVMELFEATRVETSYQHTTYPKLPEPLTRKRRDNADEVWEARPKFTNTSVPDGTEVTELDVNAAYLAALQSAHLPIRTITHNPEGWDDPANYGKGIDLSGICRIDPIDWEHPELPHPLGDDRETSGTLWVPTSVLLSLKDFASPSYGELCALPVIREAYVAKGSASLFKTLVHVLNNARMKAISEDDELTKTYVATMYAKLVSTMGDSRKNHELRRPEWQHIIRGQAFSNLRRKAIRAYQAGLTVAQAGGTDELHLTGDVWAARWSGKPLFTQGRALNQIKIKKTSRKGEK
ncbi:MULTISPECIES: DnaB-like helicase C-terminal domain-containing protein [unclassified Streptomyces]|uniref:DnaB-like helicase C-terminal domain-containing protein n=1 Tax=unclassified Streptomyces TaxID=2593676 RepID=UPI00037BDD1F|nr:MULTISPECIES: DnaB-like helicase C-terminal domain-containing protein [unclassified Streptomyces]MYT29981.1 AAA family ATPase [Streptomyces sp. SID8354]